MNVDAPTSSVSAARDGAEGDDSESPEPSDGEVPEPVIGVIDRTGVAAQSDLTVLKRRIGEAAAHLSRPLREVMVAIVGDDEMAALHEQHLGERSTTDVLSFDLSDDDRIEAQIVICLDEAVRRANTLPHSVNDELLLYALHGLLHCCGYDDHEAAEHRRMHAEEDRILRAIGVGSIFSTGNQGDRGRPGHDGGPVDRLRDTES